jgi:hypothetical protein
LIRPKGTPVAHDHHKPVSLQAPQRGHDGGPGHAVLTGQCGHRGQPLIRLPFTCDDPRPHRVLHANAWQFWRTVNWHSAMIANTV